MAPHIRVIGGGGGGNASSFDATVEINRWVREGNTGAHIGAQAYVESNTKQYAGNWYKQDSPKKDLIINTSISKTKTPNLEAPLLIKLGGPFEQVGGDDEAIGSDHQKVD